MIDADAEYIYIQFLDSSGWRTCQTMSAKGADYRVDIAMREAMRSYPNKRIRAINDKGNIVDML